MGRGKIKCVYFSFVCLVKGAGLVLEAARLLPDVEFHFYGRIDDDFENDFFHVLDELPNALYHGVFDSVAGDVLGELNAYDLHLLPTNWENEGVPGVLVETKMAAVPSIVSNVCHNAEIIEDGVDGVVLRSCTADELAGAIELLDSDPLRLDEMKHAALESAERFYVDRYIDHIVADLAA